MLIGIALAAVAAVAVVVVAHFGSVDPSRPDVPVVLPRPAPVYPPVTGAVVRIAPDGTGRGDTSSWSDAAPINALPAILAAAAPGTQVWLRADAGPYHLSQSLQLHSGGAAGAPVVVRGVDAQGAPLPAEIIGDRAAPYDPNGARGDEVFRLLSGADHLVFQELAFRNVGNGAFRIGADISDLTIRQITATNVRRFIENTASGAAATATISGLTVSNVTVKGYSRSFARIRYDSHDIVFDGNSGDSEGQDHDPFSQGIQLNDTVHDVDIRNTSMTNSISTDRDYWNGDGFSAEEQTYDIRFTNTYAAGNTDGGYDIKSRSATMIDVRAADNKRNFRFWGNITVDGCTGTDPKQRGGTGTQAQVHATSAAVVTMTRCTFIDDDPRTIVFDVDGTARLTVTNSTVEHAGSLETVEPRAALQRDGVRVA
ncbi:MAG: hypothetical protein L0H84_00695 [Pseudonocardia sp.]|nr:hypothetical protein [Pseudonocardia sp.]